MANRWFRLPQTGDGSFDDPYRPDLFGYDVDGWAGNASHPNGPPKVVVRVFADTATLDELANESQAQSLENVPVKALNNMFGQNRDAEGWDHVFNVQ